MQRPRTTYKFSPELAAQLEAQLRQGHVARSDTTARVSSGQTTQQVRRKKEMEDTVPKTRAEGRQRAAEKAWERREQRRKSGKTIDQESSERAIAEATKPTGYTKLADFFHQLGEAAMADALIMSGIVNPIRTAFSVVGGALGGNAVDKTMQNLTKSDEKPEGQTWSEWVNDKLGLRQGHMVGQLSNPGILLGGVVGYKTPGAINTGFKYAQETVPIVARNYRLSTAIDRAVDNTKLPFGNNNYTTILSTQKTSPDTGAMVLYQRPQSKLSLAERTGVNVQDRDVWNPQVMNNAREFARKYGYEEPNSIQDAKDMYRQHNRFFRTVNTNKFIPSGKGYHEYSHLYKPGMTEQEVINAEFPEFIGMTPEQIKMQLASKGYPTYFRSYYKKDIGSGFSDDFVFVSPSLAENMDYAGNTLSNTILLQRPFSFGKPSEWHINADWRPSGKIYRRAHNKGEVSEGNSYFNHEAKVSTDHLIPVKIAETGDKGTLLGEFLNNNRGLLNNETQPVQFINLEETFTPVTRQFVHPSEAVRKAYTAPNLEGLEMTTAEPLMNRSAVEKVPEGAKIVGEFKGEPLIEINGKKYLLSKYNELHGGAPDLGYDPKVIAEEAKKDFTGPLARIIDNSEVLTSLADKIKRGEATTEFSRNKGTLVDPNARDVLAGELADIKRGKQKRGVALVNTMPTNITTTGQETYAGRGNFGLGSFSVTNHPGAVRAYGAIDYPKLIQHIKDSKMLTDNEKNSLYSYLKRMKELDKDPLSRMTENTDAKIKLNPEEDIEYQNLISQVNKLIPGTFEYGGLNRHILYQALKEPQIINVSSKSDKFGVSSRNVAREQLPLTDFQGHRLMTFNPKYNPNKSTSVEQVHGGYVGNILEAERLIGGYKYKNKFGNWEKEPGWNQTPSILQNLMGLLRGTNGKFYVRGVGPNGVPGAIDMVTLQAPNGGIPGFKLGNKLNYYKHV